MFATVLKIPKFKRWLEVNKGEEFSRGDGAGCPVASYLQEVRQDSSIRVGTESIGNGDSGDNWCEALPNWAMTFIEEYDKGKTPDEALAIAEKIKR